MLVDAGLSEKGAERQYNISKYIYYFFLAHQVCKLNNSASYSQENLLKGLFGFDDATIKKYVFEKDYTLTDLDFLAKHSKVLLLKEKKSFADLLFKLSFVQDGIHNDEWNLLMQFLKQLKFNDNYIAFFKRRYGPLRTEFDEDKKDNVATELRNTSYLKPYYAILGLDNSASEEEIKKAYHALALEHHPDLPKNAGRVKECEEMMTKINEAYEKIRG
ncbi:MAG: DnaJ domain-containing protein [Paludibacteraceae bacterium]|nr:DnaJ domain-containing protein [Paludibacteraceae bacterium]